MCITRLSHLTQKQAFRLLALDKHTVRDAVSVLYGMHIGLFQDFPSFHILCILLWMPIIVCPKCVVFFVQHRLALFHFDIVPLHICDAVLLQDACGFVGRAMQYAEYVFIARTYHIQRFKGVFVSQEPLGVSAVGREPSRMFDEVFALNTTLLQQGRTRNGLHFVLSHMFWESECSWVGNRLVVSVDIVIRLRSIHIGHAQVLGELLVSGVRRHTRHARLAQIHKPLVVVGGVVEGVVQELVVRQGQVRPPVVLFGNAFASGKQPFVGGAFGCASQERVVRDTCWVCRMAVDTELVAMVFQEGVPQSGLLVVGAGEEEERDLWRGRRPSNKLGSSCARGRFLACTKARARGFPDT